MRARRLDLKTFLSLPLPLAARRVPSANSSAAAAASARYARNVKDLETLLQNPYVEPVPVTWTTAERFGRIDLALRTKGEPIPMNHIWIAGETLETGADSRLDDKPY